MRELGASEGTKLWGKQRKERRDQYLVEKKKKLVDKGVCAIRRRVQNHRNFASLSRIP